MKLGHVDAIKMEGGKKLVEQVRAITSAGIPVMGHIGLTPQSIHSLGGFIAQGKTAKSAQRLFEDAQALEEAGAFAIVIESVPPQVAEAITNELTIPTIGIGSGKI